MSIVLNRPIEGLRAGAERAVRWWIAELRAAWTDAASRIGEFRGNRVTIEAGEQVWLVRRGRNALARVEAGATAALSQAVGGGAEAVVVHLPPDRVLSKTISLPAGAEGTLGRILPFEIGRHFPFPAERVFFGYRVIAGPHPAGAAGTGSLLVQIAAVPRETIFAVADELRAAGLRAACFALSPAADAPAIALPADPLLPAASARGIDRRLVAVLLALAMAAAISWPVAQQVRLSAIEREIATLKPAADAALKTRSLRERGVEQEAIVARLRATRPTLVEVLDRLSRDIPDGAWLLSLSVSGRDVVLDGLAPSAASIALLLQKDGRFSELSFRAPIARDPGTGLEHFQLGATLAEPAR